MYDIQTYLEERLSFFDKHIDTYSTNVLEQFKKYKVGVETVINKSLCNIVEVDFIVKTSEVIMVDNLLEFDFNKNLFGCNNGVYDIDYDCFRPYKFDDFITMSCGFDFEDLREGHRERELNEDDIQCFSNINIILTQIFPVQEIQKLVMLIFSSGISGKCIEKFFMFYGVGGNGKGLLDEFMKFCLGDYFYEADITILTQPKKGGGSANPDMANIDKKRFLLFKEPSKHCTIQNNNMKDMTGGGCLKARDLYSSKTDCALHNTTAMECNEKIKLKDDPTRGDIRRMVGVDFESIFTDNPEEVDELKHIYLADPMLKEDDWKIKHRVSFLNMLFMMLQELKEQNYSFDSFIPKSVKDSSEAYLLGCFDIQRIFVDKFEKSDDSFVSLQDIAKVLKVSTQYRDLTKIKQREMTNDVIYDFFKTNQTYKKLYVEKHQYIKDGKKTVSRNILQGWKIKPDEDEEEEEEEE